MDDTLNQINSENTDYTLQDIAGSAVPQGINVPEIAVKNIAATTAMLGDDPSAVVDNYNAIVTEAQSGSDSMLRTLQENAKSREKDFDMKSIMSILSDPKRSIEEKRIAMSKMRSIDTSFDSKSALLKKSIISDNPDDTQESSDVRITAAETIDKINKHRDEVQSLVNAHGAGLAPAGATTFFEAAEAWVMPFGNNISVMNTFLDLKKKSGKPVGLWDFIEHFATPGVTNLDILEQINSLPVEARYKFKKDLIDSIKNNSGILFSNDNQFAQFQKASDLLGDDTYGNGSAFLDDISSLLDVIGIGSIFRSAAKGTAKAVKGAANVVATPPLSPLDRALHEDSKASPEPSIFTPAKVSEGTPTVTRDVVSGLEEERAKILGDSSGLLDKGGVKKIEKELANLKMPEKLDPVVVKRPGVTAAVAKDNAAVKAEVDYQQALADFEAKHALLTNQLEIHRAAAKNEQRLAELDKLIAEAKKSPAIQDVIAKKKLTDEIQRIDWRQTLTPHNPSAPGNILSYGNPAQARALHSDLFNSQTEELASALFHTTRQDALAGNIFPQMATSSSKVLAKSGDIERALRAGVEVLEGMFELLHNTGRIEVTQAEKASARANILNDFRAANGLTLNEPMSSFALDGGRVKISAMYGGPEGGFLRAVDAAEQAILNLRKYGVTDKDITIMKREGLDYVPLDSKNIPTVDGDYFVKVDTYHEIGLNDITAWSDFTTRWNFTDRIPVLHNWKVARNMFTPNMMFDPIFTKSAARSFDLEAKFEEFMLGVANNYAEQWKSLDKIGRAKVDDYIRDANFNEIVFDKTDLLARGFLPQEIEAVTQWRKYWDSHFYLENYDLVRTLRSEGFKKLVNSNVDLIVKEIPKNGNLVDVFDPSLNVKRTLSKAELDDLYNKGGSYARLRRPAVINGEHVEHVIVRNNINEYARAFNDSDRVLNYKNGYFQIQYKAPRFIDEITEVAGKTVRRAIAVSGDPLEAAHFSKRMALQHPDRKYIVRGDDRALKRGTDDWWDVNSASGRIAQRHRGKLLEDAAGVNHLGDTDFIIDPVTSAIRAARSISGRTISRNFLETSKARVIAKYGDMFEQDMGSARWPRDVSEIGKKGQHTASDVADARSMYEYINYLENGYVNSLDESAKGFLNALATMLSEKAVKMDSKSVSKAARAAFSTAETAAPLSATKNSVFHMYIGLNPLRQLIVQPSQAIRLFAYDPKAAIQGMNNVGRYIGAVLSPGTASAEAKAFQSFVDSSGMLSAVDKHNLVRGALVDAADSTNKVVKNVSKAVNIPRKIGFDTGERMNQLSHLSVVYQKFQNEGKNLLDKEVRDSAYAEARALGYSMNFAGDMPYNQNSMSFILQFMQIPHKALMQVADRSLSPAIRARMLVGDAVIWGLPIGIVSQFLGGDVLGELENFPLVKQSVEEGLEQLIINKLWQYSFKDDSINIDYSSLNPYDISGWVTFMKNLWSGGGDELLNGSAAGTLMMKDGSKISNIINTSKRFFNITEDSDITPTTMMDIIKESARLSSGFANADKALFMLQTEKRLDKAGNQIGDKVSTLEAISQAFGFGSYDARKMMLMAQDARNFNKKREDDVRKVYNEIKRFYTDKLGVENTDVKWITGVTGHMLSMYKDDPQALQIFKSQLQRDLGGKDNALLSQILRASGWEDSEKFKDKIRMSGISDETKVKLMNIIQDAQNVKIDEKDK